MLNITRITAGITIVLSLHLIGCASPQADRSHAAEMRSADEIIAQIEAIEFPRFDPERRGDEEYQESYREAYMDAQRRQNRLIGELYHAAPDHEQTERLLPRRWQAMMWDQDQQDALRKELSEVKIRHPETALGRNARFTLTQIDMRRAMMDKDSERDAPLRVIEAYLEAEPDDPRGASLLLQYADALQFGSDNQIAKFERIQRDYPDTRAAHAAAGNLRQIQNIGEPFELAFTCVVTGSEIDVADLRGKVVVIDFWATWCGPCVAKMPEFKEIYEQYDGRVAVIGISLDRPEDQGGLDELHTFVAENDIPWPQYYQGGGWESEFSSGWGINSIPTLFVLDTEGRLHSTNAWMGSLEEIIDELLVDTELAG